MKKVLLILFVAVTTLTACKKDSEDKLKGRWDLAKDLDVTRVNGTVTSEYSHTYDVAIFTLCLKKIDIRFTKMAN
ncbi:hypothetical protein [Pedobacter sp. UBA4863]|uniref:hypothetical protein n=1 Tax=Pedobacter sp. UBA4863 TaxID=1947060 RepID=UPI0025E35621|nr:hypothetical protein [Pedobacter sp. UBA4863]